MIDSPTELLLLLLALPLGTAYLIAVLAALFGSNGTRGRGARDEHTLRSR
jgi:hypothetical protein